MEGPAAKERRLWPALVAAMALLLTAPQAFASRTASARPELLASPALEQPIVAEALVTAYAPRGFELHATADPHPRQLALFPDLAPPPASFAAQKLASGVASWEPRPNLQRIQVFVAETWWVRENLGAVDSPNLYAAFGLDPHNNTDPLGLRVPNAQDKRIRLRLSARLEELDTQWKSTGSAGATVMDTEARPKCLLCTESEYVPVAHERSASTEAEYQELRARLAGEIADFDAAVAKADRDDVIEFRGGGLQGEGPYFTAFTKLDAVANAEAMAWFNVGASEQVAANAIYLVGGVKQSRVNAVGPTVKGRTFRRSMTARREALLRDAQDPNSGLTQEQRDFILANGGKRVPENMEVSHEEPLYTRPPEERPVLDVPGNMKTQEKPVHRDRHIPGGDQYEKFGPPSSYPWNRCTKP